jgi:hypothetical protein
VRIYIQLHKFICILIDVRINICRFMLMIAELMITRSKVLYNLLYFVLIFVVYIFVRVSHE